MGDEQLYDRYREALEFYADKANYNPFDKRGRTGMGYRERYWASPVDDDTGDVARAALGLPPDELAPGRSAVRDEHKGVNYPSWFQ